MILPLAHPANVDVRAIILLDCPDAAGYQLVGYADPAEVLDTLLAHVGALCELTGTTLHVAHESVPDTGTWPLRVDDGTDALRGPHGDSAAQRSDSAV